MTLSGKPTYRQHSGDAVPARALMLRTAPCFTVAAVPVSIAIAGAAQ